MERAYIVTGILLIYGVALYFGGRALFGLVADAVEEERKTYQKKPAAEKKTL